MEAMLRYLLMAAIAILYFVPAMIAHQHHHRQELPILLVNVLLGWTVFGWIAAMVWSVWTSPVVAMAHGPAESVPDSGFCGDCGSPLEARASFCPACGYRTAPFRG